MTQSVYRKRGSVHGVGVNDADYSVTKTVNNKLIWTCPYYTIWKGMLGRCYNKAAHKYNASYEICTVHSDWHRFTVFKKWMEQQNWEGKCLDKDIIQPGNKEYGPSTCCFVPANLNSLFINYNSTKGNLPQGVNWIERKKKYRASIWFKGKRKYLGYFPTAVEASLKYRLAKHLVILDAAYQQNNLNIQKGLFRHADLMLEGL